MLIRARIYFEVSHKNFYAIFFLLRVDDELKVLKPSIKDDAMCVGLLLQRFY